MGSSPCAGEPGAQGLALDVGHHVVEEPARFARVVHREDVRVLEPGGGLDLPQEALGPERGGELGAEHLDGHLAVVPQVLRQVDRGHPPAPELALDDVAVGQSGLEAT